MIALSLILVTWTAISIPISLVVAGILARNSRFYTHSSQIDSFFNPHC